MERHFIRRRGLLLIVFMYNFNTPGLLNCFLPIHLMKWSLTSSVAICHDLQAKQQKMVWPITHWSTPWHKLLCIYKNIVIVIVLILGVILRVSAKQRWSLLAISLQRWLEGRPAGVMHDAWIFLVRWVCVSVMLYWQHVTVFCMLFFNMLSVCLIHLCCLKKKRKRSSVFWSRGKKNVSRIMLWHKFSYLLSSHQTFRFAFWIQPFSGNCMLSLSKT